MQGRLQDQEARLQVSFDLGAPRYRYEIVMVDGAAVCLQLFSRLQVLDEGPALLGNEHS